MKIPVKLVVGNRERLRKLLLPGSLAVVNANDIPPTNGDSTLAAVPNSDLYYLTGIGQEQSILLMFPDAEDPKQREMLFLREPTAETELWEGHKYSRQEAIQATGIQSIHWLAEFPRLFHRLMCECQHVYLDSNEHKRAVIEVATREARFVADTLQRFPLHDYQRLAPLMHQLRAVKSTFELDLLAEACRITERGFRRVLRHARPGCTEARIHAEFAHEFIRHGCRFAYEPIIGSGKNSLALHYTANSDVCRAGDMLLLDVAAAYKNYNADMTRTIPVSGRFTRRQRQVYNAVLRVLKQSVANLRPGKTPREWQKEGEQLIERELIDLKLLSAREVKRQDPDRPALKRYFMHGLGHPLGLDVHDVGITTHPLQAGWVMTVEPGIYIREENLAVRLEDNVVIGADSNLNLMETIPIEADEIEALLRRKT